jgi:hypothetical protein
MRRLLRIGIVAALGLVAIASVREARADFETFMVSMPQTTTDYSLPMSIQGFNPSLGTLTDVILTWSVSGNVAGTVTNTAASPQNFTVTETSVINLFLGSAVGTLLSSPSLTSMQTYANLAVGATSPFGPFTPAGQDGPTTYTSGPIFNGFISAGNIGLTVMTVTGTTFDGGGGNILGAIATTAGGTFTVRYDFTPVPEPSSIALSLVGILGVGTGAVVRRRKLVR